MQSLALELRAEYDARIKELRSLLPEAKESRERFAFRADEDAKRRPVAGFSTQAVRDDLNALTARKRALNAAIQRANFDSQITVQAETMSLSEALELRKAVNEQIGELSTGGGCWEKRLRQRLCRGPEVAARARPAFSPRRATASFAVPSSPTRATRLRAQW